jgi:hypothetical protein
LSKTRPPRAGPYALADEAYLGRPGNSIPSPSYDDLRNENKRLKAILASSVNNVSIPSDNESFFLEDAVDFEHYLFEKLSDRTQNVGMISLHEVEFPPKELSEHLLRQGSLWTSWIHFALHHPTFEEEHRSFWIECETLQQRVNFDPHWLAVYFSFLSASFYPNLDPCCC